MSRDGFHLTALASGSSGNCFALSYRGDVLLVDAGLSGRKIEGLMKQAGLDPDRILGLVLTHEHSDHVAGIGVLSRRYRVPVVATGGTLRAARRRVGKLHRTLEVVAYGPREVGPFRVLPFPTHHDAAEPMACVVEDPDGARIGILTDIGEIGPHVEESLAGCRTLLLESNHDPDMLMDGPYPWPLKQRIAGPAGHLSNRDSAALAGRLAAGGLRRVIGAHLSRTNNSPEKVLQAYAEVVDGAGVELVLSAHDRPTPSVPA